MINICPCCNQPTPINGVLFASNTVSRAGQSAHFTPHEAAIFGAILKRAPEYVSSEKIIAAMYGAHDGPENERNVVAVLASRMRRKLAPLGLVIESRYSKGYRLEVAG